MVTYQKSVSARKEHIMYRFGFTKLAEAILRERLIPKALVEMGIRMGLIYGGIVLAVVAIILLLFAVFIDVADARDEVINPETIFAMTLNEDGDPGFLYRADGKIQHIQVDAPGQVHPHALRYVDGIFLFDYEVPGNESTYQQAYYAEGIEGFLDVEQWKKVSCPMQVCWANRMASPTLIEVWAFDPPFENHWRIYQISLETGVAEHIGAGEYTFVIRQIVKQEDGSYSQLTDTYPDIFGSNVFVMTSALDIDKYCNQEFQYNDVVFLQSDLPYLICGEPTWTVEGLIVHIRSQDDAANFVNGWAFFDEDGLTKIDVLDNQDIRAVKTTWPTEVWPA